MMIKKLHILTRIKKIQQGLPQEMCLHPHVLNEFFQETLFLAIFHLVQGSNNFALVNV
jgi:hypothetical protein